MNTSTSNAHTPTRTGQQILTLASDGHQATVITRGQEGEGGEQAGRVLVRQHAADDM